MPDLHRRAAAFTARCLGAATLLATVAACGYKGPLYMPTTPRPEPPADSFVAPPTVPGSPAETMPIQPATQTAPAPSAQ